MTRPLVFSENIRPILASIRTVPIPPRPGTPPRPTPVLPFITIARQAGAGAWTLAQTLVDALNASMSIETPWTCWDRELVDKISADYHLSEKLVGSLGDESHTWLQDFLSSLSFADSSQYADEAKIYGRAVASIRALAQAGRVVIVGRGGVFITRRMPGGIHLYLVAPLEHRIEFMAQKFGLSRADAAEHVRQLERNRRAFFKRYWPSERFDSDTFTVTLNTAELSMDEMVAVVKPLALQPVTAATR